MKRLSNDEFKLRANAKHNNFYDYSKTDLNNRDEDGKVVITCPIHGDFKQEPNNHLRGIGCGKCCGNIKKTKDEVIAEIHKIHGDKYIIPDDFEYKSNKSRLHIICPEHGDFYPTYHNFVKMGCDCKKCTCHVYNNDEFINNIKKLYNDKLKYDFVDFKGYRNDVLVICSKCGKEHLVKPKRLLNGNFTCDCAQNDKTVLENVVESMLIEQKYNYIYQYKNEKWLKNEQPMSLDFYLPDLKIGIECQGRFHFEPYKKNDDKSILEYKKQVNRDKLKKTLCEENNINLLYFSNIKLKEEYIGKVYNNKNKLLERIKKLNYGR